LFFIREKDIYLDCFTCIPHVYDYAKISHGRNYKPNWLKDTPKLRNDEQQTIKNCTALLQFYEKGIVIPSWCELELTIGDKKDRYWSWESSSDTLSTDNSHDSNQFEKFAKGRGNNIKINSPWRFKTKKDIKFVWSQPTWSMRDTLFNFSILPGVLEFRKQHATHINLFIEHKDEQQFCKIPSLEPLAMLHPLTEKKIIIKNHLVSEKEMQRIAYGMTHLYFNRNFLETQKNKNRIKEKLFNR